MRRRGARDPTHPHQPADPLQLLEQVRLVAPLDGEPGRRPAEQVREVPETTQVGSAILGQQAVLAARGLVQVGAEDGYQTQSGWWLRCSSDSTEATLAAITCRSEPPARPPARREKARGPAHRYTGTGRRRTI